MSTSPHAGLALAIGKFDALHLGHRELAVRASRLGAPGLLTFTGMAEVLGWPQRLPLVAPSLREKVMDSWSQALGRPLDCLSVPFHQVRDMSPARFVDHLCGTLQVRAIVVGDDFRFGKGRSGDVGQLTSLAHAAHCRLEVVAPVLHEGQPISSSRVRSALEVGDVALVRSLLGRDHCLVGTVVRGDGRGRTIGVPTANCGLRENQEPGIGVYAAWAGLSPDGSSAVVRYPAAVNVGRAPTVGEGRPLTVEAHLLGYQGECYGSRLTLSFIAKLREERRFDNLEALKQQLSRDLESAESVLAQSSGM